MQPPATSYYIPMEHFHHSRSFPLLLPSQLYPCARPPHQYSDFCHLFVLFSWGVILMESYSILHILLMSFTHNVSCISSLFFFIVCRIHCMIIWLRCWLIFLFPVFVFCVFWRLLWTFLTNVLVKICVSCEMAKS